MWGEQQKAESEPKAVPSPMVLSVDLHCIGCAKKIEKSLLQIRGVAGVKVDMVKNQVTVKGVVEPEAVCNKIMEKIKTSAKVLSPVPVPDPDPDPDPEKVVDSDHGCSSHDVELNVNMHCEACAQQLRRKILKMKGVSKVETEVRCGKVRVMGTMDGKKLVEYVYRRTKKQAKIVPHPQPHKAKEEGEVVEKEDEKDGDEERMMPAVNYLMMPAPQLFSDENPNACCIS
ncbi:heavy metal-associated isoprenylated plant protein 9-like [Cynara cardunculus var. scolymus]|uniref:heavy metal-associated isoprenylated plant protein 9-like n=1 Tax=Cynara cardunculus var. scolymus TaxID=59895 RepID=UPI000D6268E9|nr:heavy metal-associated isoprenylated plant protein 9-like [Cynara cardunculus var. scolymus]